MWWIFPGLSKIIFNSSYPIGTDINHHFTLLLLCRFSLGITALSSRLAFIQMRRASSKLSGVGDPIAFVIYF